MINEPSFERGAARVVVAKCRMNAGDVVTDAVPLGTELLISMPLHATRGDAS
jgi:hypothetical protein